MIKSMTGFSNRTFEDGRATIGVTARSVNHRYLDVQMRVPASYSHLEQRLRATVQQHVARGRVEVAVSVQLRQEPAVSVELNQALVAAMSAAVERAREAGLVSGSLSASDLLRFPQAFTIREVPADLDEAGRADLDAAIARAVAETMVDLDGMRVHEGERLRADLDGRKTVVADMVEAIARAAREGESGVKARLEARLAELAADVTVDRAALAQEVVRFAARSDISEEVVRFRAHTAQWTTLSEAVEPCGRKLDFLLQEMNREVNTMGSKADGPGVPELVVAVKAELEKMREQAQNVE